MLNFDGIMKDALEVGLLTTNELDRLTDEVASGAKTEAALAEEWGTKALHFAAKGSVHPPRRLNRARPHAGVGRMPTRVGKGLAGRCNRGSEEARGQWGLPPATLNTPTQGVCFMCVSCPCRVLHSHD